MDFIKLTCERCGGVMTIDDNCCVCKCPYCGAEFLAVESDGVKKYKIQQENERIISLKRLEYKNIEDKRSKRHELIENITSSDEFKYVMVFICLMIVAFIGFIPLFLEEASQTSTPVNSKEMLGKNYEEAVNRFMDAGFKTIETVEVEDLKDTWFSNASSKVNTVVKITIGGKDSFKKDEKFKKDDTVRIYYHIYPKTD